MSSNWPVVTLQEVTSILGDGLHGTPKYDDNGEYYFINGNNLSNGKIVLNEKTKRATKKEYLKHKKNLNDRTILVSINGTLGNVALYNGEKVFLGKSACYFNVNEGIDKQFIRYIVTSYLFQKYIHSLATGSTIKNVSLKLMRDFSFRLPPLFLQKKISKILEDLDNKIELNRQTNQNLEHIAQAIFKSWFVDFEPTRAKIAAKQAGQDPERAAMAAISGKALEELDQLSPEQLEQLKTTAALFPDEMVDSELGEVPEGWNISPLTSVAEIIMGQSPKGDTYNDAGVGIPLVNGPVEFGNYHTKKIKWTTAPTRMSINRDLIVCVRGSTTGRFVKSDGKYCLGRGVCAVRSVNFQPYVDYLFKSEISKLLRMTTGSTFPSWNGPVLKNYRIIQPSDDVIGAFTSHIESMEFKISSTEVEIERLSALRDTLLPKLLSGELEIPSKNGEVA